MSLLLKSNGLKFTNFLIKRYLSAIKVNLSLIANEF